MRNLASFKQNWFMLPIAVAAAIAALNACSPRQGSIVNKPPVIEESQKLADFSLKIGAYSPDLISSFFWPVNWTEQEFLQRVPLVQQKSKSLIDMLVQNQFLPQIKINQLWGAFRDSKCIETFHGPDDSADPGDYFEDSNVNFLTLAPVAASDAGYPAYQAQAQALSDCAANQSSRKEIHSKFDTLQGDQKYIGEIKRRQDEITTILGTDNNLTFDPGGSKINFKLDTDGSIKTTISLLFTVLKKSVSTEKTDPLLKITLVKVSPKGDRLSFVVPNPLDATSTYLFDLTRLDSLAKYSYFNDDGTPRVPTEEAVYQGDLTELKNGVQVRTGSAQLIGKFSAQ